MKITEALEQVSRMYVPGVAKFYNGMNPDPWHQAHEDFEQAVHTQDEAVVFAGAESFVARCARLIEFFKEQGVNPKGISNADAMFSTGELQIAKWQSRKFKECYLCHKREKLKIVTDPEDENHIIIVCSPCEPKMRKAG